MKNDLSVFSLIYLASGKLYPKQKSQFQSPSGVPTDGNLMFNDAFLTQIYWLEKQGFVKLTPEGERKVRFEKRFKEIPKSIPPFTRFVLQSLAKIPQQKGQLAWWVENIGLASPSRFPPGLGILEKAEILELDPFKKEQESKFLFFRFKSKVWDKQKIEEIITKDLLEEIKNLINKAQQQPWWNSGKKALAIGLGLMQTRRFHEEQRWFSDD